jgi:hypothetical protein
VAQTSAASLALLALTLLLVFYRRPQRAGSACILSRDPILRPAALAVEP